MSILGAAPEGDGGSSRFAGRFSGASTQAVEALLLSRDGRSGLRLPAPAGRQTSASQSLMDSSEGASGVVPCREPMPENAQHVT